MVDYSDLTTVYGRISVLEVEQVESHATLRCKLKTEGNVPHNSFFAYLDGDDAMIVFKQLDLMREAFVNRLRVRLLYTADESRNWKRFYDLRVYRED